MRCSPRWMLTLAAALALVVPGCGIRHSQSYLAKRAAVAAAKQTAHASRRNITLAQAPPAGSAARGVQADTGTRRVARPFRLATDALAASLRVADAEATEETSEQQGLVAENPSHLAARRLLTVWPVVCADCVGRPFERPPACCRTAPTGS